MPRFYAKIFRGFFDVVHNRLPQRLGTLEFLFGAQEFAKFHSERLSVQVAVKLKEMGFTIHAFCVFDCGTHADVCNARIRMSIDDGAHGVYAKARNRARFRKTLIGRRKAELMPELFPRDDLFL